MNFQYNLSANLALERGDLLQLGHSPGILGQGEAGGMPISAIVTSDRIVNTFNMGSHGTTYGGSAVCERALTIMGESVLAK